MGPYYSASCSMIGTIEGNDNDMWNFCVLPRTDHSQQSCHHSWWNTKREGQCQTLYSDTNGRVLGNAQITRSKITKALVLNLVDDHVALKNGLAVPKTPNLLSSIKCNSMQLQNWVLCKNNILHEYLTTLEEGRESTCYRFRDHWYCLEVVYFSLQQYLVQ